MPDCSSIDPLVTPYVDGELAAAERQTIEQHLGACPPCRSRVDAERTVRALLQHRKPLLHDDCAPGELRARCTALSGGVPPAVAAAVGPRWRARRGPLALAALLVLVVGGAFLSRVTATSPRLMAAELTADHVKCFAMNAVLRAHQSPAAVESSMAAGFNWNVHLPDASTHEGLELVGSRPCLYGQGKVAHIMYKHNGRPVSLFMLPGTARAEQLLQIFGHEAAIWSVADRTFVLIAREERSEVQRMAAFIHAGMK
jgi:anti-sigma factor RsiW